MRSCKTSLSCWNLPELSSEPRSQVWRQPELQHLIMVPPWGEMMLPLLPVLSALSPALPSCPGILRAARQRTRQERRMHMRLAQRSSTQATPQGTQPRRPAHTMQSMSATCQDRLPAAPLAITPASMTQQPLPIRPRRPAHTMQSMSAARQDRLPTGLLLAGRKLPEPLLPPQVPMS